MNSVRTLKTLILPSILTLSNLPLQGFPYGLQLMFYLLRLVDVETFKELFQSLSGMTKERHNFMMTGSPLILD